MKPGLLQPTLVRVSDDAAMTIRELARAVKAVHRVYRSPDHPTSLRLGVLPVAKSPGS